MRCVYYALCFFLIPLIGHSQNFKYIQPKLTDSTEVVKAEIDSIYGSEYIYYIDYSKNSEHKKMLVGFTEGNNYRSDDTDFLYEATLKNIKNKPQKINLNIPSKWIQLYKYKGNWILYDNIPKYELRDSCLIKYEMEDFISIIKEIKNKENKIYLTLIEYNNQDINNNLESEITIKILDKEKYITLWRIESNGRFHYRIMLPTNQVINYPIMVLESSELLSDETDIFDEIDYEKLWND